MTRRFHQLRYNNLFPHMPGRFTIGRERHCDAAVADALVSRCAESFVQEDDRVRFGVVMIGIDELVERIENTYPKALTRRRRASRIRCTCCVLKSRPGQVGLGGGGSHG
jgi:hypothetical protein